MYYVLLLCVHYNVAQFPTFSLFSIFGIQRYFMQWIIVCFILLLFINFQNNQTEMLLLLMAEMNWAILDYCIYEVKFQNVEKENAVCNLWIN